MDWRAGKIIDGATIGGGSIVAVDAVVTKDVLPYWCAVAKLLKMRFDEKVVWVVNAPAYWDRPEEWLETNYKIFADLEQFLKHINKP